MSRPHSINQSLLMQVGDQLLCVVQSGTNRGKLANQVISNLFQMPMSVEQLQDSILIKSESMICQTYRIFHDEVCDPLKLHSLRNEIVPTS